MTDWEEKAPAFQFYVRDWLNDINLRRCSRGAKGLWIDALCLMWIAPRQGHLECETREELCQILGGDAAQTTLEIDELIRKGAASSNGPGHLSNRRMSFQAKLKQIRICSGAKGGKITQQKRREILGTSEVCSSKTPSKASSRGQAKSSPSSSSSSSGDPSFQSGSLEKSTKKEIPLPSELNSSLTFQVAFDSWLRHKSERKQPYKPQGLAQLLKKLAKWGPDRAIAAIEHSLAANYSGIFEPSLPNGNAKQHSLEPVRRAIPLFKPEPLPERPQGQLPSMSKLVAERIASLKRDTQEGP